VIPAAPPRGTSPSRWSALCEDLLTAGLVHDRGPRTPLAVGEPDAQAWGLLDPHRQAGERVEARRHRAVAVLGLGPAGLSAAVALAAAGVGTVVVDDDRLVRSVDLGPGGYRWSDVGACRAGVAAGILHDAVPTVTTTRPGMVDLVVLVDSHTADPVRASTLVSHRVPHLSVVVGEAGTCVGPLVAGPGGPCLCCLDLHRADDDPHWDDLVAKVSHDGGAGPGEVGVVAGLAGHLGAALVLAHLDGDLRPVATTWEITLPDPVPRARDWTVHPRCACAHQASVPEHTSARSHTPGPGAV